LEKPDSPAAELVQRLFPSIPILKEPDPVFLKHGLVRAGIAHQMQATRNPRGADLIESLLADLETILP
jgi:hypothetical protein